MVKTMKKTPVLAGLLLTSLLASCGSNPTPPVQETDPPLTQIQGQLVEGRGNGTVILKAEDGSELGRAAVDNNGAFTLPLPAPETFTARLKTASEALSAVGCSGTLNSSAPAAKGYGVAALRATRTDFDKDVYAANLDVQLFPPKGKLTARVWLYTDQATRLTGTLNCSQLVNNAAQVNLALDVQTRAGWNLVAIYAETQGLQLTTLSGNANTVRDEQTIWRSADALRAQLPF